MVASGSPSGWEPTLGLMWSGSSSRGAVGAGGPRGPRPFTAHSSLGGPQRPTSCCWPLRGDRGPRIDPAWKRLGKGADERGGSPWPGSSLSAVEKTRPAGWSPRGPLARRPRPSRLCLLSSSWWVTRCWGHSNKKAGHMSSLEGLLFHLLGSLTGAPGPPLTTQKPQTHHSSCVSVLNGNVRIQGTRGHCGVGPSCLMLCSPAFWGILSAWASSPGCWALYQGPQGPVFTWPLGRTPEQLEVPSDGLHTPSGHVPPAHLRGRMCSRLRGAYQGPGWE